MIESKSSYPFIIMNTDQSDKKGMHWWSFLDLRTKKEIILFESFGFEGFKEFVLDNDRNILSKILYSAEKIDRITLIILKVSMLEYEKNRRKKRLTDTAIDLLHLINKFGKSHEPKNEVTLHFVDGQLQMIEKDTCVMYQLYFCVNLF